QERGLGRRDRARPGGGGPRAGPHPADRALAGGRLRPPDAPPDQRRRPSGAGAAGGESMRGFWAVLRKEGLQMVRDKASLRFALMVPVFQLVLFGLIDTNVRHVPTVVFDQSRTQESRDLVADFVNTSYFDVVSFVPSRAALRQEIVAG